MRSERGATRLPCLLVSVAFSVNGCGGVSASSNESAEQSIQLMVAEALHAKGWVFDHLNVDVAKHTVVVDDDMIVELEDALASNVGEVTLQGYATQCFVSFGIPRCGPGPNARPVLMWFDPTVSATWRAAFNSAATQWSSNPCIQISSTTGSTCNRLIVTTADIGNPTAAADTKLANAGRGPCPGTHIGVEPMGSPIRLNTGFSGGIESLSNATKVYVALHEIGHSLGFLHPEGASSWNHVPGTALGVGYSTVMHAAFDGGTPPILTSDDGVVLIVTPASAVSSRAWA